MTAAATDTGARRASLYAALQRRNRIVSVLRIVVPIAGAAFIAVLGAQLVVANMGHDFTIGRVSIAENRLSVDAPSYAGRLADGSIFSITAGKAEAALGAPNLIDLADARVVLERPDGITASAQAAIARLDTDQQSVDVGGVTEIAVSRGLTAQMTNAHLDVLTQTIASRGPVHAELSETATLDAESMEYDAKQMIWRFSGVTVVLTSTPGESAP